LAAFPHTICDGAKLEDRPAQDGIPRLSAESRLSRHWTSSTGARQSGAALAERGDLDEATCRKVEQRIPLKRFGRAAEVAGAGLFLAYDRASYISGQSLE
jgi:NAD(P)-dependent dehydrogenase (short-subunit alcohol dehydrogenase family)